MPLDLTIRAPAVGPVYTPAGGLAALLRGAGPADVLAGLRGSDYVAVTLAYELRGDLAAALRAASG